MLRSLIFLLSITVFSADSAAEADEASVQVAPSLISQTVAIVNSTDKNPYDPDNSIQRIPSYILLEELKPNVKAQLGARMSLVLRPRFRGSYFGRREANVDKTPESKADTFWQELFLQWNLSDRLAMTWGRQNFQWGAAESMNASNRLVRDLVVSRQSWNEPKGKDMVRLNFTPSQNWSLVAAAVVQENQDEERVQAEQIFQQEAYLKSEFSWNDSADHIGLVLGGRQHDRGWLGAYFSYSLPFWEGMSLYGDGAIEQGSRAFYPEDQGVQVNWQPYSIEKSKTNHIVVTGLKFDFTDGSILRGEYLFNQFGYDEKQWQARDKFFTKTPQPLLLNDRTQFERAQQPGLDLLRQRYAFVSLYLPNFVWRDCNVSVRSFNSLDEASGTHYLGLEYFVTEAGALLLSETVNSGSKTGEWMRGISAVHSIGYRHQW